ncbi:hypothetical protein KBF38_17345 [bacterium]|nr:hypothetical protein [bacterium]
MKQQSVSSVRNPCRYFRIENYTFCANNRETFDDKNQAEQPYSEDSGYQSDLPLQYHDPRNR